MAPALQARTHGTQQGQMSPWAKTSVRLMPRYRPPENRVIGGVQLFSSTSPILAPERSTSPLISQFLKIILGSGTLACPSWDRSSRSLMTAPVSFTAPMQRVGSFPDLSRTPPSINARRNSDRTSLSEEENVEQSVSLPHLALPRSSSSARVVGSISNISRNPIHLKTQSKHIFAKSQLATTPRRIESGGNEGAVNPPPVLAAEP